jgi:hypothetical protein
MFSRTKNEAITFWTARRATFRRLPEARLSPKRTEKCGFSIILLEQDRLQQGTTLPKFSFIVYYYWRTTVRRDDSAKKEASLS